MYKEETFDELIAKSYNYNNGIYMTSKDWIIAKYLYETNYLNNTGKHVIPKKIHQIWLGSEFPDKYKGFRDSWIEMHPDWEYRLWTDKDVDELDMIKADLYHESKNYGLKSDIMSYEILYKHGGLYVDTDFECLKPFDDLLNIPFFLGVSYDAEFVLYHGIMGATPKNHIVAKCITELQSKYNGEDGTKIMDATGPYHLTRCFVQAIKDDGVQGEVAFPMDFFYPLPNNVRGTKTPYDYIKPSSYAIHHWETSWLKK